MNIPFKVGLKLHSSNVDLINEALALKNKGFFDYIELYVIPGSYETTVDLWSSINIEYVIHAPHSEHGMNLARSDMMESNKELLDEVRMFADVLNTKVIIVHGGNNGSLGETIRQLTCLGEGRIVLENKPKVGLLGEECVGWSPDELRRAVEAGAISTITLDFVHAACVAHSLGLEAKDVIKEFLEFAPRVFHLSDGDALSERDVHRNFGKGDLGVAGFVSVIPAEALVTIETPRTKGRGLYDFEGDVRFLKNLLAEDAGTVVGRKARTDIREDEWIAWESPIPGDDITE